jgi:hypothetical protein
MGQPRILRREALQRVLSLHCRSRWSNRCSCGARITDDVCPTLLHLLGTAYIAAIAAAAAGER